MKIDSHHHFWNYSPEQYGWISEEMAVLRHDFGPTELQAAAGPCGIDRVISVQARQTIEESDWLLEIAEGSAMIAAVVGWVPLADASAVEHIERLSHHAKLRAVRHVVQDEPDDAFILGKAFNEGIGRLRDYGLVYDILIFAKQLANTIRFVDMHPEQPFVLDHIAKPTVRAAEFDAQWAKHIRELARRENVSCKFSGVVTEVRDDAWDIKTLRPYWDVALEAFGPDRLMYGSDWPVCLLRSEYRQWFDFVSQLVDELSPAEQASFWAGAATRAYGLR